MDFTSENQKLGARNPVHQGLNFGVRDALKLTYEHLEVKKIFRGLSPRTPWEGHGWEGKGGIRVGKGRRK
jgi:hypothetical protein